MRSFFDRLLVAATDDFHDRRKRGIEEAAHLAPCIAVSLPHETVTDQADVQFLHIVLGSGCVHSCLRNLLLGYWVNFNRRHVLGPKDRWSIAGLALRGGRAYSSRDSAKSRRAGTSRVAPSALR